MSGKNHRTGCQCRICVPIPLVERFLLLFKRADGDSCWLWTGSTQSSGYGQLHQGDGENRRAFLAHRLSYEHFVGPIPADKCVLHRCDTPRCVRPDHLFLGTRRDNVADMNKKGRRRGGGPRGSSWGESIFRGVQR